MNSKEENEFLNTKILLALPQAVANKWKEGQKP